MEAYKIKKEQILILSEEVIYYISENVFNDEFEIVIDEFYYQNQQLIYQGVRCVNERNKEDSFGKLTPEGISSIKFIYQHRKAYPKINPKQLLTHHNKQLREFIKEIFNGNLSNSS